MFDSQVQLLSRFLTQCALDLAADPANAEVWARASDALGGTREKEPDLAAIVDAKDAVKLRAIAEAWAARTRRLPEHDLEVMRRAMKAFRKSLKITQLDAESSIGGRGLSTGRSSGIVGMSPPTRFPREVWDELVRAGELRGGRHNVYELPPGA